MNLAINARDAMPNGGRLLVETADIVFTNEVISSHEEIFPGPYTMIAVSDTGYGMSHDVQNKIFEPFFTTKDEGRGTGLGLSTVYGIVKQHNGYIYVYSEPDKGTTFKIYLPVKYGKDSTDKIEVNSYRPTGSETLLVVEDESSLRKYIVEVLQPLGYNLIRAANGSEALDLCENYEGEIDLLLTDVIMPGINGRQLADKLVHNRPEMKVIFMSGYTSDAIARHGVLEDGVNFMQKPVTSSMIANKIRNVLDAA